MIEHFVALSTRWNALSRVLIFKLTYRYILYIYIYLWIMIIPADLGSQLPILTIHLCNLCCSTFCLDVETSKQIIPLTFCDNSFFYDVGLKKMNLQNTINWWPYSESRKGNTSYYVILYYAHCVPTVVMACFFLTWIIWEPCHVSYMITQSNLYCCVWHGGHKLLASTTSSVIQPDVFWWGLAPRC